MTISPLQKIRSQYKPKTPALLNGPVTLREGQKTKSAADQAEIQKLFPNTYGLPILSFNSSPITHNSSLITNYAVGVVLSGGQAPGGHNVIAGLFDGLKKLNSKNKLFGFLSGPSGLLENKKIEITQALIDNYRNTGGFDIIGSGRTKLETEEQFDAVIKNCTAENISAIIIIGGDDSNTNACMLAEYALRKKSTLTVVGCPKTIDGDLKNEMIEASFGFDTACKVYSELIGNIMRDALSAKKYWHFIRLMGRSASHITLECALQTHPNIALISEEVAANKQTLSSIVENLARIIMERGNKGLNFGVALIPEGLVEFIPEIKKLIAGINDSLAHDEQFKTFTNHDQRVQWLQSRLDPTLFPSFLSLPSTLQSQLLLDRDPHGNVQVSLIETEKMLIEMVKEKLNAWKKSGEYKGKFGAQNHFFGYEGRCSAPSNFDADYCYSLGLTAAVLASEKKTGYMACVKNLSSPASKWVPTGVPITMLMNLEQRHGKQKPVIQKALVDLKGKPYSEFKKNREMWALTNDFVYPGPIQYFGPAEVCDLTTRTLALEA